MPSVTTVTRVAADRFAVHPGGVAEGPADRLARQHRHPLARRARGQPARRQQQDLAGAPVSPSRAGATAVVLPAPGGATSTAFAPPAAQRAGREVRRGSGIMLWPPIAFTERTLPNGLRVIAIRDTTTPSVSVQVWYDVGSKHDPDGRSGFAHLFEHILSRKTRNMPYNMINRLTENVGGVRNASTWFDRTNYYETVPAQYLETMLWSHAERMARPVIDAEVFNTERNVVKEEFRQRVLAPAYGRLRLALDENSHDTRAGNRRSGIGSLEQLDAATLEDALAFHEAYYGPDTATLIVAGNFDPARLDSLVNRYFGAIERRKERRCPLAINAAEKPRTAPRTVTVYAPNVPLPLIASSWRIPDRRIPTSRRCRCSTRSSPMATIRGSSAHWCSTRPIASSALHQLQRCRDMAASSRRW
jgi:hypothetical protein